MSDLQTAKWRQGIISNEKWNNFDNYTFQGFQNQDIYVSDYELMCTLYGISGASGKGKILIEALCETS